MHKLLCLVISFISFTSHATHSELTDFDIESLLAADIQITSAMKRTGIASQTAASVYVLTQVKIKASGASSIPQALKLVPGMQVRKIDNNKWAIGIRNPAGRYTSRLLVMVDGQSIYNPATAGVYWEALNYPIDDIERIEVIRGQGGVLWGSNATNGVVNIITKMSIDTRTTLLKYSTGNYVDFDANIRIGGDLSLGDTASYRVYANSQRSDSSKESYEWQAHDSGKKNSIGARVDISVNPDTSIIIQGDYTHINIGQTINLTEYGTWLPSEDISPATRTHTQLMFRLDDRLSDTANQLLQLSYSMQDGYQPYYQESFKHYDLDYQVNMILDDVQINVGANYRYNSTPFNETTHITSQNGIESINYLGLFAQTSVSFSEHINLMIGNKTERNNFTGWENQPSLRLSWQPNDKHFLWGAISQGVRIPSLFEYDYKTLINGTSIKDFFPTGIPSVDETRIKTYLLGNDQLEVEKTLSFESGYRFKKDNWKFDISTFYSEHKNVLTVTPKNIQFSANTIQELLSTNDFISLQQYLSEQSVELEFSSNSKIKAKGIEFIANWQANNHLYGEIGYTYSEHKQTPFVDTRLSSNGKIRQLYTAVTAIVNDVHFINATLRAEAGDLYNVDDYEALDITWRWQLTPSLNIYFIGENLTQKSQLEFKRTNEIVAVPTYIDRRFSFSVSYEF